MPNLPTFSALAALRESASPPVYLFDRAVLASKCHIVSALTHQYKNFRAFFMTKANWSWPVMSVIAESGLGVVVSNLFELELAQRAGFPASYIRAVGPAKDREFLSRCISTDILEIVVESLDEAREISDLATSPVRVAVRVRLDIPAHARASFFRAKAIDDGDKFGFSKNDLPAAAAQIASLPRVRLAGLASNLGSQICSPAVFERGVEALRDLALALRRRGILVDTINIGGGLPVQGISRRFNSPLSAIAKAVIGSSWKPQYEEAAKDCEPEYLLPRLMGHLAGTGLQLWMEPGRWLVGDCMFLVTTVVRSLERDRRAWLYVNGGIDQLPDAGFGERRTIHVVGASLQAGQCSYAIGGPLCMKGDVFTRAINLPLGIKPGDFVIFGSAGAYGFSRVSWFGGRLPSIAGLEEPQSRLALLWKSPDLTALASRTTDEMLQESIACTVES